MSNNIVPMQTVEPIKARTYTPAQLLLVRRTVAKDTTDDEFSMFMEVCKRVGLDPFRRQIYCLVYNKDNAKKRSVAFITGIDGFRACAARNGNYRPDENEPELTYLKELENPKTNPLGIEKAVVTVHQMDTNGQWHPIKGVAYWDEFAPLKDEWVDNKKTGDKILSGKWPQMGRHMLAKCAEAQADRKGWPEDLSGIYAPEEMEQAHAEEWNAAEQAKAAHEDERLAKINARNVIPLQWDYNGAIEFTPEGQVFDRAMAWIRDHDAAEVDWFTTVNTNGLKQFWAVDKAAALELKKALEQAVKPQMTMNVRTARDGPGPHGEAATDAFDRDLAIEMDEDDDAQDQ